jgi:hypothetical protein
MPKRRGTTVDAVNVSLLPRHLEMIDAAGRAEGLLGRSAALRMLLDRLARLERAQARVAADADCDETARATEQEKMA